MELEQAQWTTQKGWTPGAPGRLAAKADLVLLFGSTEILGREEPLGEVRRAYPAAQLLGCSTAGEIHGTHVTDDGLICTAVRFDHTRVRGVSTTVKDAGGSYEAGRRLATALRADDELCHAFVLSDGLQVNGSELVRGLTETLPPGVTLTGGLAGDSDRFMKTLVFCDAPPAVNTIAAVGFYGKRLRIGFGSLGGWDPFGPTRLITRSKDNVLFELDGKSALALYKKYLGEYAAGLPSTGLLYPLAIRTEGHPAPVVRTILAVNEEDQSMTFAGDMPVGAHAQLMKANFNRLIDGAVGAARTCQEALRGATPDLALLISCVGRKMVLKQRIEEEVEAVREVLGGDAVLAGFYSYGEISPFTPDARCELHNQTMTITTLSES